MSPAEFPVREFPRHPYRAKVLLILAVEAAAMLLGAFALTRLDRSGLVLGIIVLVLAGGLATFALLWVLFKIDCPECGRRLLPRLGSGRYRCEACSLDWTLPRSGNRRSA